MCLEALVQDFEALVDGFIEFVNLPCLLAEGLIDTLKTCVECRIDALETFLDLTDTR